jgi:hypothetical protein
MESLFEFLDRKRRERGPMPPVRGVLAGGREAAAQMDAAMHGASDVIPFGAADRLASVAYSTAQPSNWMQRYRTSMAAEAARDREDAVRYPIARAVGQLGMTAATLGRGMQLTGVLAAPRLPGAAKITSREALSLLGAGSAVGVGAQAVGDLATGQRSSPGDYAGAGIGGLAGVVALPRGPERAAAFDGAVTSMAQDLFNGRQVSLQQAGQSAVAARTAGVLANKAAMNWAENLPSVAKGKFGEALGALRGVADWQPRVALGKTPVKIPGTTKSWKPDAMKGTRIDAPDTQLYEDKFGRRATLLKNQKLAQATLGDNFQLNHFMPRDVGKAASSFAAALGIQSHERVPPPPKR